MTGYDERFAIMDKMGVDVQLVMPPPPQCYHTVALEYAVPAARMINEGVAEFVSRHKDRFIPCGTVPMQDGNEAAKELEHCMKTLGFKGVEILTNVAGKELSDPAFAPFWKKAEELGALVIIHPNGFTEGQRLSRLYFNNVIGNPFETTLALHYLIFDGVLERHPNLKIFAMHGGGYLGAYSGRIDHAWGARSDSHAESAETADQLSEKGLCRHRRVHARTIESAGRHASGSTTSSWGPTIPSTCWNTIRSATSPRSTALTIRRAPRSSAAMRKRCWGCRPADRHGRAYSGCRHARMTAKLRIQKIQHGRLGDDRRVGAVPAGARLLFRGARGLQIGTEVARALDDAAVL